MPHMMDGSIDGTVQLFTRKVPGFPGTLVQELLKDLSDCGAIAGWGDLLGRNGYDADFLVGLDGAAQELLYGGLHALWQVVGFLVRDIPHTGCFLHSGRTKPGGVTIRVKLLPHGCQPYHR